MAIVYIAFRDAEDDGTTKKPAKLVEVSLTTLKTSLKKSPGSEWTVHRVNITGAKAIVSALKNVKKMPTLSVDRFEVNDAGKLRTAPVATKEE